MNWEPAHADHSIDSVSVVIGFSSPIGLDVFDDVIVAGRKAAFAHHFVNRVESLDPLQIQPGQQLILAGQNMIQQRRVAFQRLAEGAVIGEFSISASGLVLTYSRYTSWTDFKDLGLDLLKAIEAATPILSGVNSLQLQYLDRFTSTVVQADPFEVISKTSPFLASVLADKTRAFHCHAGWFDYVGPDRRKLTNVNITVVDNSPPSPADSKTSLTMLTMARIEALAGSLHQPLGELTSLHDYLKAIFEGIITEHAATRVALTAD